MEPRTKYITGIYHHAFDLDSRDNTLIEDRHEAYFENRSLIIDKNNPHLFISLEFDWGSWSKGTRQLALSILLELTNLQEALRYEEMLTRECLTLIPSHRSFSIQVYALQRWLNSKKGQPNQETDLLFWLKIEEPQYHKPIPSIPEKTSLIIPLPPIQNKEPQVQKKENPMEEETKKKHGPKSKYPFGKLEVGGYFYFLNPTKEEIHRLSVIQSNSQRRYNTEYTRRVVLAQWAREHKIEVAQDSVTVCIVWRTA